MGSVGPAVYLDINLTTGTIERKEVSAEVHRLYPGGSALATYLLLRGLPAGIDALGPENILVLAVGPLAALPISGIARMTAAAKSPLTGAIGDSQVGGFIPPELKRAGVEALLFRGRAPEPVYLWLKDGEAELRPAGHLWGKVTGEVEDLLRQELADKRIQIAQVGPAGERGVRYAAIMHMANRANGRTGMGAVMGSKNLKAVVIRGTGRQEPANPEAFRRLSASVTQRIRENPEIGALGRYGTDGIVPGQNEAGGLPTRNYQSGFFAEADQISGQTMETTILKERDTCYSCAVRCKRVVAIPGDVDPRYGGPEYETAATFGSYCGVSDLAAVARANQICNMYGLDTISCGATIAFAMECQERGLLPRDLAAEAGHLGFGNAEAMVALTGRIARREGALGRLLGEGSARVAATIGGEAAGLSMTVKGHDIPAHMPQVKRSLALIYAVNPFGADHQSSEHDFVLEVPPDHFMRRPLEQLGPWRTQESPAMDTHKVRFAYTTQLFYSLLDTIGLCQFVWGPSWQLYGPNDLLEFIRAGIGWDTSMWELMKIGERRLNLLKAFNVREGFTRTDDRLPDRLFQPLPDGPSKGIGVGREELERAIDQYYAMAGWDPTTGIPTRATLEALDLGWLAESLKV